MKTFYIREKHTEGGSGTIPPGAFAKSYVCVLLKTECQIPLLIVNIMVRRKEATIIPFHTMT